MHQEEEQHALQEEIRQGRVGQRWIIEGLSQEDFHARALALQEAMWPWGIVLGAVYHVPIGTGVLFVKEVHA